MVTVHSPGEQRVMLHHVTWETYERLLAEHAGRSAPRLTYDQGELEVMSPLPEHERLNRAIQFLVPLVAGELGVKVYSLGSTTFRREDLQRGFDPDSCFYMQHLAAVRGKRVLDLAVDPPPDLVVEIDITRPSLPKVPIYAAFRVPEVWRYDGARWHVLLLAEDEYAAATESRALPRVTAEGIAALLDESPLVDDVEWMDRVRQWARTLRRRETP